MEHVFQNNLNFDSCPFTPPGTLERDRPTRSYGDHGWIDGCRSRAHKYDSIRSLFDTVGTSIHALRQYPAPAVSRFIMRRQTRCNVQSPVMREVLDNLPNLDVLHWEP